MSDLIPNHGGYRNLVSFQVSQLVYDITIPSFLHIIPLSSGSKAPDPKPSANSPNGSPLKEPSVKPCAIEGTTGIHNFLNRLPKK